MDQVPLAAIQRRRRPHWVHPQRSDHYHHYYARATERYRRNAALLARLADRVVGRLTDELLSALGIKTQARSVVISHRTQRHILERRQIVNDADADLAAHRIGEALENLQFEVLPRKAPHAVNLVGFVPSTGRSLEVALKFVTSNNSPKGQDECWVSTAILLGRSRFRKFKAGGRLKQL